MSRPAVFLDRDGVLNRSHLVDGRPHPPPTLADLELEEGAAEACERLAAASLPLVVVTNQPDVRRGLARREDVEEINAALMELLPVAAVYVCFHDDADNCRCRKPRPGLLEDAAGDLDLDLARSVAVGDRWSDVAAGRAAGCATVFIDRGYGERRAESPDLVVGSLLESVPWILERL